MKFYQNAYWMKIHHALLISVVATLPFSFPFKLTNVLILVLLVHTFFRGLKFFSFQKSVTLSLIPFYLINIIGAFYSSNEKQAFFEIEKMIYFLIFPIVWSNSYGITRPQIEVILKSFVAACLVASIVCISHSIYTYLDVGENKFFYYDLIEPIGTHPIYLAMYVCLSCFIIIFFLLKDACTSRLLHFLSIVLILWFTMFLFLLSARMEIIAFTLICAFGSIWYGVHQKKILTILKFVPICLMLIFSLIWFLPANKERFKEAINYDSKYSIDKQWGGRSLRLLKWSCSYEIIKKNLLVGVGTGDAQDVLQACYYERGYNSLTHDPIQKYNAHSQYLQTLIDTGIVGLLTFFIFFFISVPKAFIAKDYLFLSFLTLFLLACLTESMLEINKGIIFFTFFGSLFLFRNDMQKQA